MLPSTKALHAFACVVRFGGVRAAAAELNLTQSAISHQITALEKMLGTPLFDRRGRGLELTEAGQDYFQHIGPALDWIQRATRQAARSAPMRQMTIAAPPTFLATWLIRNAARIEELLDGAALRFVEALVLPSQPVAADLAIEYRFQPEPTTDSRFLMADEVSAFAAPDYARNLGLKSVNDIHRARLIETERRLSSWNDIVDAGHVGRPFLTVGYSHQAYEAASLGLGIALGNRVNAAPFLRAGTLIEPFTIPRTHLPPLPNYFITIPAPARNGDLPARLRDWLIDEIGRAARDVAGQGKA
ncbi:hypothetical protein BV394_08570 [Brevirhabdus pacifica]|uniref:Uncharacterized protein n=1 Tax=Brevirhabdus pacifica TaxID=1267768 RepID=A0A1U7DIE2_9RHOB|nr:LysR family transcriptional regulator [Brevirhabdus pacifica]APX89762.1 hypothetical protein BV394_08570 [Brevirhabdus pacifica]PJJ85543.1 LysR family glycine cleavage system transcriptional activator [Brevirhabdus pacifica]